MSEPVKQTAQAAEGTAIGRAHVLKLLIELGPLVVFFAVNAMAGIFWGTGVFMVATVAALAAARISTGRVPIMPLVTGVFVVVFGGLTLWLQNDQFIKVKPTIVYLLFAAILFGGLFSNRLFLKTIFGEIMHLTEPGWRKLTLRWAWFFIALAILNEFVWRSFSTDFWVSFKLFGVIPLTMIFAAAQVALLKPYEQQ